MLPPGNSSGCTTKVSVDITISPPSTGSTAPSPSWARAGVAEVRQEAVAEQRGAHLAAGTVAELDPVRDRPAAPGRPGRRRASRSCVRTPQPRRHGGGRSCSTRRRRLPRRPSARRAGAPGCTAVPKAGHSSGLSLPRSTSPARHSAGSSTSDRLQPEPQLGVEVGELLPQHQPAPRNGADAAPLPVGQLEDLEDQVPGPAGCPRGGPPRTYWFSTSCRPSSSWRTARAIPSRMSTGSKPVTTIGTRYRSAIGSYSVQPMTLQTCPAARKPCTRLSGASRMAVIAGGTVTWETRTLKLGTPSSRARQTAMALAGAVVSKPTAKNTTCALRVTGWPAPARRAANRRRARRRPGRGPAAGRTRGPAPAACRRTR